MGVGAWVGVAVEGGRGVRVLVGVYVGVDVFVGVGVIVGVSVGRGVSVGVAVWVGVHVGGNVGPAAAWVCVGVGEAIPASGGGGKGFSGICGLM